MTTKAEDQDNITDSVVPGNDGDIPLLHPAPAICCLEAKLCIRFMCIILIIINCISLAITVPQGSDSSNQPKTFCSLISASFAIAIFMLGLCSSFSKSARFAQLFFFLVAVDFAQQLAIDILALIVQDFGTDSVAARIASLAINFILNGCCTYSARQYMLIRLWDPSVWPEMEATQQIGDRMNRFGMPSHDEGVAPHDAGYTITGFHQRTTGR